MEVPLPARAPEPWLTLQQAFDMVVDHFRCSYDQAKEFLDEEITNRRIRLAVDRRSVEIDGEPFRLNIEEGTVYILGRDEEVHVEINRYSLDKAIQRFADQLEDGRRIVSPASAWSVYSWESTRSGRDGIPGASVQAETKCRKWLEGLPGKYAVKPVVNDVLQLVAENRFPGLGKKGFKRALKKAQLPPTWRRRARANPGVRAEFLNDNDKYLKNK